MEVWDPSERENIRTKDRGAFIINLKERKNMQLSKLILYWKNYEELAQKSETIKTVAGFRGYHGKRLAELQKQHPTFRFKDDQYTMLDVQLADQLNETFGGRCDINLVGPFPDRDDLKPCLNGQMLAWICEDIQKATDRSAESFVEKLREEYPYLDLELSLFDASGEPCGGDPLPHV